MIKMLLAFFVTLILLSGTALYIAAPRVQEVTVQEKNVEEEIAAYLHGWNLSAYINQSMVSFHSNKNSEGEYIFTAVNVDVTGYEDEYIELLAILSKEWFDITDSRIVHFINSDGIVFMWTNNQGIVQTLLKKSQNV